MVNSCHLRNIDKIFALNSDLSKRIKGRAFNIAQYESVTLSMID